MSADVGDQNFRDACCTPGIVSSRRRCATNALIRCPADGRLIDSSGKSMRASICLTNVTSRFIREVDMQRTLRKLNVRRDGRGSHIGLLPRTAIFAVSVLAAVSMQQSGGTSMAAAATHPSSFAWSGTHGYGPGWELDSPNGIYKVVFQGDRNLVVYHNGTGRAIWSSGTAGATGYSLVLAAKGLVSVSPYCTSPSGCSFQQHRGWGNSVNNTASAHHLNMQNDGNFVEYTGSTGGSALWASNTVGK